MAWVHQVINRMRGGTSEEAAKDLAQQGIEVIVEGLHLFHHMNLSSQIHRSMLKVSLLPPDARM